MSTSAVRQAFVKAVKDQVELMSPTYPIAWPNKKFVPPNAGVWLAFHWMPADRYPVTLGDGGEDELIGFVQIDVNGPQDAGDVAHEEILSALENYFVPGRPVLKEYQSATVTSCVRVPGRVIDPYWRASLTLNFSARIVRDDLAAGPNQVPDFSDTFNTSLAD